MAAAVGVAGAILLLGEVTVDAGVEDSAVAWLELLSFANGEAIHRRIRNPIRTQVVRFANGNFEEKSEPLTPMDAIVELMKSGQFKSVRTLLCVTNMKAIYTMMPRMATHRMTAMVFIRVFTIFTRIILATVGFSCSAV
ncbi:MAG: hypothetical protein ACFN4E_02855 [Corynebacterium matruchotii]